jgi:DNA-directed RNA polymerase subunit D
MIKIENYDKENKKLTFVTDMSIALANSVRRSVLEIPILAIDEVEIFKNDSALYDEIVAHRMGLIPIKNISTVKEAKYKLKKKGPGPVYSTDIEPSIGTDFKIPITILEKDQEIEIVADAKLGKGVDHIKYSPGLIYYKHNIPNELLDYVYIDEEGKITYDEVELNPAKVSEEIINKVKKLKSFEGLLFTIEGWGQIGAKDIFSKSIEALNKNLSEFSKAIK